MKSFYPPLKKQAWTYENIKKIPTAQGDYYTTGCLLDYPYFEENYNLIATDVSK